MAINTAQAAMNAKCPKCYAAWNGPCTLASCAYSTSTELTTTCLVPYLHGGWVL